MNREWERSFERKAEFHLEKAEYHRRLKDLYLLKGYAEHAKYHEKMRRYHYSMTL